ncbi:MAG: LuxR C-terminal-related transcriptional regulator [Anaerolineales bacterium]
MRLIANGMTNSQIAEKLVISENTVKGHVSNILVVQPHLPTERKWRYTRGKKGLVNREQVARK